MGRPEGLNPMRRGGDDLGSEFESEIEVSDGDASDQGTGVLDVSAATKSRVINDAAEVGSSLMVRCRIAADHGGPPTNRIGFPDAGPKEPRREQ